METKNEKKKEKKEKQNNPTNTTYKKATFAGGCFWCMTPPYKNVEGIKEVVAGYTGGNVENPSYQEVSTGETGHYEAVQILYDPEKISYDDLLDIFWKQIDPTDPGGQFADRGSQYKTAIFYHSDKQRKLAEKSKKQLAKSGQFQDPIVTKILPFEAFYKAEAYHQDYYKKKPKKYKRYKKHSGRKHFIEKK